MTLTDLHSFLLAIPTAFMALITVINPLGTSFILSAMTKGIDDSGRKNLAKNIVINTLGLFLIVLVLGKFILSFFGLNISIIQVGGGLLLANIGWSMLNASDENSDDPQTLTKKVEDIDSLLKKSFYPFTFPIVCGPGCMAIILTLAAHHTTPESLTIEMSSLLGDFVGLVGVAIVVYFCYIYSIVIEKKLGQSGAESINRILAFVTFCIGLQITWTGIRALIQLN